MSRMSEAHQDLESIHNILLGQRQVAMINSLCDSTNAIEKLKCDIRVQCINDLLLEFEAAGVEFPTNVVEFTREDGPLGVTVTSPPAHPEDGVVLSRIDRFKLNNGCPLI